MATRTKQAKTVTTTDKYGNEIEVAVGVDGKTPQSANNPSPKALADDEARDRTKQFLAEEAVPSVTESGKQDGEPAAQNVSNE